MVWPGVGVVFDVANEIPSPRYTPRPAIKWSPANSQQDLLPCRSGYALRNNHSRYIKMCTQMKCRAEKFISRRLHDVVFAWDISIFFSFSVARAIPPRAYLPLLVKHAIKCCNAVVLLGGRVSGSRSTMTLLVQLRITHGQKKMSVVFVRINQLP